MIGNKIYDLASQLWPFDRSLTGDGVRKTLSTIKKELPNLKIYEVPTGTKVFDWTIPKEWRVKEAYIRTPTGQRICEFNKNNLHLVGYSIPVRKFLPLNKLIDHLHSLPNQPNAIPYITSYYEERWGFCMSHNELTELEDGEYEVVIDSELFDGSLTYGELIIPGLSKAEVFISTYVCHPSMANNELSGPCVTTFIAKELLRNQRKYTYRIVFIPETIGSITYLSQHHIQLKENVIAGFNVSCIGDDRSYSYLPSRNGKTLSDTVAKHVLKHLCPSYISYSWFDRGSDERQYCAPGIDLPIASIMRSKFGAYDEYHTSLDNLVNVVTAQGLEGGFNALWKAIETIEMNCFPQVTVLCEPQLSKRDLYPTLSTKTSGAEIRLMMDLITWSDGTRSLVELAELFNKPIWELYPIVEKLRDHQLIHLLEIPINN